MPQVQYHQHKLYPECWQNFPNGETLLACVEQALNSWWPRVFGYHLLKLGPLSAKVNTSNCSINHQINLYPAQGASLRGEIGRLPLQNTVIDAVLANFLLEFEVNPYPILREADRVLISGGYLFLTGFNPLSPAFLGKLLPKFQQQLPWCGHFYLPSRVKDWLALLGYQLVCDQRLLYHPLFGSLDKGQMWQHSLASWLPGAGSIYLLVARKLETPLTPIREQRRMQKTNWQTIPTAGRVSTSSRHTKTQDSMSTEPSSKQTN